MGEYSVPVRLRNAAHWPIVINDAPVRCGLCGEPIIGSGEGTIAVLREAILRHRDTCEPVPVRPE